jgi:hypothetical protein
MYVTAVDLQGVQGPPGKEDGCQALAGCTVIDVDCGMQCWCQLDGAEFTGGCPPFEVAGRVGWA